jgi:hypothetical protein
MKNIKRLLEKYPWITYVIGLIPFVAAVIGYAGSGEFSFFQIVYAALALYFVNPVVDFEDPYILFAKLAAAVVVAGIILSVLKYAFYKIEHFFIRFNKDATVVYTDNELGKMLGKTLKHGYIVTEAKKPEKVQNHIFMLSDDAESIKFYSQNEKAFYKKNVYMMMNSLDSTLLKAADCDGADLHFFNINDLMARDYWKKNNLYNNRDDNYKIAIVGYGEIGEAIFKYGYLNNIYSLDQTFEYHIWGCEGSEADFIRSLSTENSDKIVIHEESWDCSIDCIAGMDRIIYTLEENQIDFIQKVLYKNNIADIHCYSRDRICFDDIYNSENILVFGDMCDILTEDVVKSEKLYRQGKLFNYDYFLRNGNKKAPSDFEKEMEEEWKKLDGFKKSSSIARADHYWIEKRLENDGIMAEDSEDAWKVEHIRWSRFHLINHWKYDKVRDNAHRKHNLLVPYEELPQSEKEKDGIYDALIKAEIDKLDREN